ncbi:formate dehydrogenase subunit gamma [Oxalobacteraceae bacterium R-40]|uniref:Formate dehydrogenase subunit gamma n=1 Tax=Keguizhuia sedimenti TaxID=3064264 RepID=A0ABU1BQ94_9BURK|nr:formate dehydrogenase subunit gamma [Oxalobacteraceae bacterium R-40]
MKKVFYGVACLLSAFSISANAAETQNGAPAASPPAGQQAQTLPKVESVDIMKENQAERNKSQPGNLAPTWRAVKDGQNHYSSLPGIEKGVLVQAKAQFPGQERATTAGEAWRQYRNGPLTNIGGWALVLVLGIIAVIYKVFGPVKLKGPKTGKTIQRFTPIERMTHWAVAVSFIVLAATGIVMLFGRYVLMPIFGHTLFGWLAYAGKNIHNFVGPLFTVSVLVMFVLYVKDNLPHASDIKWLARAGGVFGKGHVSSGRFNAGEKLWFWGGVIVLGLIVSASGFVLDMLVPGFQYTRANMQIANVIHLIAALLVVAISLGHIYLGTIGMEGSYDAMRTGYVDDAWAQEHHDLWYQDVKSGKIARVRAPEDSPVVSAPVKAV